MTRMFRMAAAAMLLAGAASSALAAGDRIRELKLITRPQAAQPSEFQFAQIIAQEWRKLGLDVKVEVMPWEQMADVVWYNRDKWDMTAWQMVGRPERSDPDELLYNLYHSSTSAKGYNFVGYSNPDYDRVAEAQRREVDQEKRRALVFRAQEILAADQPVMMLVHPRSTFAFDKTVWDPASVVNQGGIGIKNFWTFVSIRPLGGQRDIVLNSSDNVQGINPLWISGGTDSWITELVWDRLLRIGPDGLPRPWAAENWEWTSPTSITVTLRPGQVWHDGKPLTAEDVRFSFEAAMGGEAPMYAPFVRNIAAIDVDGDRITFTLKEPSAAFLTSTLAKINLIPKHVWEPVLADLATREENAESHQEKMPIGSGPFRFVSWTTNEEVVLEANRGHWSAPAADRWILRIVPNAEAALGMLRSGQINFLADFPGDPKVLVDAAAADGDLEVVSTTDIGFRYVAFNNRRAPFGDPAFRRALSSAVSRELIVKAAFKGFAEPSNSIVSPALPFWHDPAVDNMPTGLDLARQILSEAGYELVGGKLHYPDGVRETLAE
ncbi:MAG: twin-arginine translocation pathway signal protein [Alphaproteobacteria bacterium]|nr:MAG: twin-arginine translocation pathway signal protein [Alphaproteobacteria bacterium]